MHRGRVYILLLYICSPSCLTDTSALADCKSQKSMIANVRTSTFPSFSFGCTNRDKTLVNPSTASVLAPDPTNTAEAHLTSAESPSHCCSASITLSEGCPCAIMLRRAQVNVTTVLSWQKSKGPPSEAPRRGPSLLLCWLSFSKQWPSASLLRRAEVNVAPLLRWLGP